MTLKIMLIIFASIVTTVLALYTLPTLLLGPMVWIFPNSRLAVQLRLLRAANIVSRCVVKGYTRSGHLLVKDQFNRLRICIPNNEIFVSPEDRLMEEVLNQLARELAPRLGFEKGRASFLGKDTVFLFSTTDSLY